MCTRHESSQQQQQQQHMTLQLLQATGTVHGKTVLMMKQPLLSVLALASVMTAAAAARALSRA
jgi:hypothetical protein